LRQRAEVAPDKSFLFRAAPSLELSLILDGIGNSLEPLREYQFNGPAGLCEPFERARVVLGYPDVE
jgi:hypothetical protein